MEEKINQVGGDQITQIFLKPWHPIVELEQLSIQSLTNALRYWNTLVPLDERWNQDSLTETETGRINREELIRQQILADKYFSEELELHWEELKIKTKEQGNHGKISYWDFVGAQTYEETVKRAFLTSFLVTYGYATLEIHPLEEEIYIKPFKKQISRAPSQQLVSIPLAITQQDWQNWKEKKGE